MKTFDKDGKSTTSSAVDAAHYPDPHHSQAPHATPDHQQRIAELAYSLWEKQGFPANASEQNWAEAERMLKDATIGQSAISHVEETGGSVQK